MDAVTWTGDAPLRRMRRKAWHVTLGATLLAGAAFIAVAAAGSACAENIRGAATGPTTAPGFSHPEQYMHVQDVKPADKYVSGGAASRAGQSGG
jgi:arylsulfatase